MEGIGRAGDGLVGPRAVQAPHEKIAEGQLPQSSQQHGGRDPDVPEPHGLQRLADERYVVGGAAAAAGLGDEHGQLVGVVPA